jgi:hypothetical protein
VSRDDPQDGQPGQGAAGGRGCQESRVGEGAHVAAGEAGSSTVGAAAPGVAEAEPLGAAETDAVTAATGVGDGAVVVGAAQTPPGRAGGSGTPATGT